ncbi:hypothetical protein MPTK2_4g08300 [Marchantia polymorpha subsp. ruderalis]
MHVVWCNLSSQFLCGFFLNCSQRQCVYRSRYRSTLQDLDLVDARRGVTMFENVENCLIDNMNFFKCSECGERSDDFGHGGAHVKSQEMGMSFLERETSDEGAPIVASSPNSEISGIYRPIALRIECKLGGWASSDGSGGPIVLIN